MLQFLTQLHYDPRYRHDTKLAKESFNRGLAYKGHLALLKQRLAQVPFDAFKWSILLEKAISGGQLETLRFLLTLGRCDFWDQLLDDLSLCDFAMMRFLISEGVSWTAGMIFAACGSPKLNVRQTALPNA